MLIDTKTIIEIINTSDSRVEMIERIEELEKLIRDEEMAANLREEENDISEDDVTETDIDEWWDEYIRASIECKEKTLPFPDKLIPKVRIDYKGLIASAEEHGCEIPFLPFEEQLKFISAKDALEIEKIKRIDAWVREMLRVKADERRSK